MSNVLDDVTDETVDATHVRLRIEDWEKRLNGLYNTISQWLPKGWTACQGTPVRMREGLMRKFGIEARQLPTLQCVNGKGAVVTLEPRALWIIGANGPGGSDIRRTALSDRRPRRQLREAGLARSPGRSPVRPPNDIERLAQKRPSMTDLQTIATIYEEIDNALESLRGAESTVDKDSESDPITRKQQINDQAYFVLAWGQLEADVVETCRETIRKAQQDSDWRVRRAWDLYDPENRRLSGLSFENRLSLVLEKGTDTWKRTMQLYSVRNQIAHGTLLSERIDVSSVIQDFCVIQSSLARP